MTAQSRPAAQYIRMSTDRQDLSPILQRQAIAAFAAANGFDVSASYDDEGRSGIDLTNRTGLRRLLKDVEEDPPFSHILVYDVSRWGRFQDVDAAAYYEYHCRLHGVRVIYVGESFADDQKPATVLLKSMRRVMAAEYSRDLACKSRAGQERVVTMGFQMGALPPFGYRRCSVSADGGRRVLLQHGQRKLALTDRIEWVLGPEQEVALVRRMCAAYASGLALEEIASLVAADGWRTEKGHAVSTHSVKVLLQHEALIGNFVWGVKSRGGKIITCTPTRMNGSVPRIIDDATWAAIQKRLAGSAPDPRCSAEAQAPKPKAPGRPKQLGFAFGQPQRRPQAHRRTLASCQQLRDHTREFGRALRAALSASAMPAAFDTRTNLLSFWGARVRVRLMWPRDPGTWLLERRHSVGAAEYVLVARMARLYCPLDFFLVPARIVPTVFLEPLHEEVHRDLKPYWCNSPQELLSRLAVIIGLSTPHPSTAPEPASRSVPKAQAQAIPRLSPVGRAQEE
jgi:DNA invertase Pin-like site-specific DNA recombinase